MGVGLAGAVAEIGEQVEGVIGSFRGPARTRPAGCGRSARTAVRVGLAAPVGQPAGRGQRGQLGRGRVVPLPAPVEEGRQGPGQLPGVGIEAGAACLARPRRAAPAASVVNQVRAWSWSAKFAVVTPGGRRSMASGSRCGSSSQTRGVGGVQVVVEHRAAAPIAGPSSASQVLGQLGGVGPQQVVKSEPAGSVLGDQVSAGQLGQQPAHLPGRRRRRGWPPRRWRCRGLGARPGAGTVAPPRAAGRGRTRRAPRVRRSPGPHRRTRPDRRGPRAAHRPAPRGGSPGGSRRGRPRSPAPGAAWRTGR